MLSLQRYLNSTNCNTAKSIFIFRHSELLWGKLLQIIMRMLAGVLLIGLASKVGTEELLIDMTMDDAFSVREAYIEVGQTITWLPIA